GNNLQCKTSKPIPLWLQGSGSLQGLDGPTVYPLTQCLALFAVESMHWRTQDMDPTWQWCERVKENNRLKLKSSVCGNTFSRGISKMKHDLAGTSKDVSPCVGGPNKLLAPFVRQQCLDMLQVLRQKRIQKEIEETDVGYNEPLEDEEEEEEAHEYDDEDDISLRIDLETSRGRDRRGKGIMYEGGRSGIMGRKRKGTTNIRARRGMRPPSGRVPTGRSSVGSIKSFFPSYTSPGGQPQIRATMTSKDMLYHAQKMLILFNSKP
ncbi:hypothetical protein EJ110_NYTH57975, partial [Nymphaea thermarum]